MQGEGYKIIDVKQVLNQKAPKVASKIPEFVISYLAHIIHQDELNDILIRYADKDGVEFMKSLVEYFGLTLHIRNKEVLPQDGRYIFVSNHPLGGLDGICLAAVIGDHYNGHIRYLVNDMLLNLPNLKSIFVPINKHGNQVRENAILMNEAYASTDQIITFPAGLCSRRINGVIEDLQWKKSFIQKAVEYNRDIIPIYFEGRNSTFFYNLANIRKMLGVKMNYEMLFLPDEMFKARGKEFSITFGDPISWRTFDRSRSHDEWTSEVRNKVYEMKK